MEYYIVDAFTDELFKGNPAGVCVLKKPISRELMQNIAFENNFSETAFVYKEGEKYHLRWFTPVDEIDLCGHATLATAFVILNDVEPGRQQVAFETVSGILTVSRKGDLYEMSFPKRMPEKIACTERIEKVLRIKPAEVYSERDLYVVLESEKDVKEYRPDYEKLKTLNEWLGVVITAKGDKVDFVSRYFCSELNGEDPVTGSSHSSLVPLWHQKLGKEKFVAAQLSERGGILQCSLEPECVKISGRAVLYLKGNMMIEE